MARQLIAFPSYEVSRSANLLAQAYYQPSPINYADTGLSHTGIIGTFPIRSGKTFMVIENTHATTSLVVRFMLRKKHEPYINIDTQTGQAFSDAPYPFLERYEVTVPATKRYILASFPETFETMSPGFAAFWTSGPDEADTLIQVFHLADRGVPRVGIIDNNVGTDVSGTHEEVSHTALTPEAIDLDANLDVVSSNGNNIKVRSDENIVLYVESASETRALHAQPPDGEVWESEAPMKYDIPSTGRFIALNKGFSRDGYIEFDIASSLTTDPKFFAFKISRGK